MLVISSMSLVLMFAGCHPAITISQTSLSPTPSATITGTTPVVTAQGRAVVTEIYTKED
jgi:hypothetical protein